MRFEATVAAAAIATLLASGAFAAPGDLDATFGSGGKVVTTFPSASESSARAVAVQADGKIVAAGSARIGGSPVIAMARFLRDGTLDASFGVGGRLTTSAGAISGASAHAVAIQPDGKIVVAGYANPGTLAFCLVARFHPNGTPDAGFGSGGVSMAWGCNYANAIALQPDGRILIVGREGVSVKSIVTARLLPNGWVDTSFSGDGRAVGTTVVPPGGDSVEGTGVAVAPDGRIVTVGYKFTAGLGLNQVVALTHSYLPDGAVDATFAGDGIAETQVHVSSIFQPYGPQDYATAVAVKEDGRILVAGHGADYLGPSEFVLIGYNPDGTLDTGLAGTGKIATAVGSSAGANALVVQSNGKILLAGRSAAASGDEFAIVRYLPQGALDGDFGLGGKVTVPFAVTGTAHAVALEPAGAIVVAGQANDGGSPSFALVRLEGDDASATIPRLGNISTRGPVLTGDDVLIGGFVIGGSANKTVAIVATGPSLAAFGIANPLANPTLRLVRSSDQAVLATNDDWQSASNSAQLTAAGLAPTNPLEAAILVSLPPGAYTAIVEGSGNGTGVAVVGVYEVDGPGIPLVNISTRGRVLTGNDVMIGGFVINGTGSQTLAIVATGPSLAAFGIVSPLANPTISLVRSSDQAVLATNDDWQSDVNASQLQAAGFAPTNTLESGLYVTLPPGAYTVIVQGVGGGTGVAVIGVYKAN